MANGPGGPPGSVTDEPDPGGGGGPPDPGGGGGGPPPGGGPMLAALAQRQQGPQVSTPGAGDQAHSMTMIMNAINMIQQALPGLQPGSPLHRDVTRAISSLSRHLAQGQPTAGVQQTQLRDLLQNTVRNALLQKIMQQQGGKQPPDPGAAQGQSPIPGAMASPMPSTPLPGA